MRPPHFFLALALLSPLAAATTWTVDVNNGPGTDFTQISDAIAAVSAGDTLIVRPGQYTGFVLDKELAIIGQGTGPLDEVLFYNATLHDLPAGSTTRIANMRMNGLGFGGFKLVDDAGAVVIDDLVATDRVQVTNSADVRFRRLDAREGLLSTSSRVEIADSTLIGKGGGQCICCNYPNTSDGGPGLTLNGGEVHVAWTSVLGGYGGSDICGDTGGCDGDRGAGGPAIFLASGARLLVAGSPQQFVQGGDGGETICSGGFRGPQGPALYVNAGCEARISGASLVGTVTNLGGTILQPTPDDPTLTALGTPLAGGVFTLRVHGPAGALADVVLGRRPILAGTPALDEEQLTPVNRVFHLGPIPANGTASLNYPVPASWAQGFSVVFQGRLTLGDSSLRYTNSLPAILQ
jgi:hypothetical protein